MVINATLYTYPFYQNNQIFNIENKLTNRNNGIYPYFALRNKLLEHGIVLNTQDINPIKKSAFIIYHDMPALKDIVLNIPKYLILLESKVIRTDNWFTPLHKYFQKIYTWDDRYIDNKKYYKLNYPSIIPQYFKINRLSRQKLCTMIANHKKAKQSSELYSERIKAIRWFETNQPESFDLYGQGWNTKSYQREIINKTEIYHKYKFVICFENASFPGYITEKIFDCFFAGCVPVYLGAPNITEHVPESIFIDMRRFDNYDDLYKYLVTMPMSEYQNYLDATEQYVSSDHIYEYSVERFVNTIIQNVMI